MPSCHACQAAVDDNDRYCPVCGRRVALSTEPVVDRVCARCGAPGGAEDRFCHACGTPQGTPEHAPGAPSQSAQ